MFLMAAQVILPFAILLEAQGLQLLRGMAIPQRCVCRLLQSISPPSPQPQKQAKLFCNGVTESEIDNAGFNIYRSETEDGEYIKINDSLIPAQGSSTQGASYEFTDTDVKNRKTYYYKLEDIDLNGTSTMHGPVSATPRWFLGILGYSENSRTVYQ